MQNSKIQTLLSYPCVAIADKEDYVRLILNKNENIQTFSKSLIVYLDIGNI